MLQSWWQLWEVGNFLGNMNRQFVEEMKASRKRTDQEESKRDVGEVSPKESDGPFSLAQVRTLVTLVWELEVSQGLWDWRVCSLYRWLFIETMRALSLRRSFCSCLNPLPFPYGRRDHQQSQASLFPFEEAVTALPFMAYKNVLWGSCVFLGLSLKMT